MKITLVALAAIMVAGAQTTTTIRTITASGSASISGTPDKAMVDLGVATQAATAQDASTQNATQVASVLAAIRVVLGQDADIKTVYYSLSPVYSNGNNPTIIGYAANNTVEATLTDLSLIGKVIDVSIAAGANHVNGIRFGLQNSDPLQAQALKNAAASAIAQAKAIASGLGVQIGNVLHASQGSAAIYSPVGLAAAAPAVATPVEPGLIQVQGTVTIEVEMK